MPVLARHEPESTIGFLPLIFPALAATATGVGVAAAVDSDFRDGLIVFGKEAFQITMQAIAIAAPIIGFIPVVGQGVAAAMTFASSLALGVPIDDALLSTVANVVPGGLAAKMAVTTAVSLTKAAIAGDPIEEAALASARELARQTGGDLAAGAFDAAVALARGESLQKAGFAVMNRWVPGGYDLPARAAQFGFRMAEAVAEGRPVEAIIIDEVRREITALPPQVKAVEQEIDRGIRAILAEPIRFAESYEQLASSLGIPVAAARAAIMSVAEDEFGALFVDPYVRTALSTNVDPAAPILGEAKRTMAMDLASHSMAEYWATPLEVASESFAWSDAVQDALTPWREPVASWEDPRAPLPVDVPAELDRQVSAPRGGSDRLVASIFGVGALAALVLVVATVKR